MVNYVAPQWLVWVLIALGFMIAATLEYHDLRKHNILLEQAPKTATNLNPRSQDKEAILTLSSQMIDIHKHGHMDDVGIKTDYCDGIDINEIIKRDCSICGIPRNQRGINR